MIICVLTGQQTRQTFSLLVIFHRFKPKLDADNQNEEKTLQAELIFIWKTVWFSQCIHLTSVTVG